MGSRNYLAGKHRIKSSGHKHLPWHCDACDKVHPGSRFKTQTLAGRMVCEAAYFRELTARQQPQR